ncbi:MAG: hypothetical protein CMH54_15190 [Myxococcales bacterium]|nr:hypothetical protein [Myxococcales bacterium]
MPEGTKLEAAQDRLSKMMERAASGEDRAMARWIRETGERMVRALLGMIRLGQFHHHENKAFEKPADELSTLLTEVLEKLGVVAIVFVEDQVYLNDIRIRYDARLDLGLEMSQHFSSFGVGGMTFNQPLSPHEVRQLIQVISNFDGDRGDVLKALAELGLEHISMPGVHRFLKAGEMAGKGKKQHGGKSVSVKAVQHAAQRAVDRTLLQAGQQRIVDLLSMRKLANNLVDSQDDNILSDAGAAAISSPFAAHCITVGQLAICIAREIGFDENHQADLVLCALTHDLGYGCREDGYATPFERHCSAGVRTLLKRRGFHESHIRRMLAVIEHHEDFAPEGDGPPPSMFARIIRIADDYDSMTRSRTGGLRLSPAVALERIIKGSGTKYDPTLVQCLVNALGKYPPGTPVQLSDNRFGATLSLGRGEESFDRPSIRILALKGADVEPTDEILDLLEHPEISVVRPLAGTGAVFVTSAIEEQEDGISEIFDT